MELLSIDGAAKRLDRSPTTVRKLLSGGALGGEIVGGRWIVTQDDITNYLKSRKVKQRGRSFPGRRRRRDDY